MDSIKKSKIKKEKSKTVPEDNFIDLYMQSLKSYVQSDILETFKENKNMSFSFRENKNDRLILIVVKLKRKSEINSLGCDIIFHIKLFDNYPEVFPNVTCLTTVSKLK